MNYKYHNVYEAEAKKLVEKMSVEEKTAMLSYESAEIERLGIPAYNWWNEGLHGVARAGIATVFPQSIGLAATFDKEVLQDVGRVTAVEGRIKYNAARAENDRAIYKGITFWSPNINIYRDPRWGRGHETYGEDPVLTAICAENYIKAMQNGSDERYLHAAACLKHFAAHSGPEGTRHGFNSTVSDFDMYDTYLPAFEWNIKKADVEGIMGAYNTINGVHCCANKPYIDGVMRKKWGFRGYYVSDCGALADIHMFCGITDNAVESAALALKSGCDLNCGNVYLSVLEAYKEGKVTEDDITTAAERVIATRFKLGMFDESCIYNKETNYKLVDGRDHRALAEKAARESIVMLKNDSLLPLDRREIGTIGVIGPNADNRAALEGNYNGKSSHYITPLEGLREACGDRINLLYAKGCPLYKDTEESCSVKYDGFAEAVAVAKESDVVVMVVGLDPSIEGEQGDASNEYGAGDKLTLGLPGLQQELVEKISEMGKRMIYVVLAGGALDMNWAEQNADAILYGWYPGCMGGKALADIIFGEASPCGKTPVTFYRTLADLPAFEDYSMENRTYRYMQAEPLYPFGCGLSYTTFEYSSPKCAKTPDGGYNITVTVKNTGRTASGEAVMVYAEYQNEKLKMPNCKLCGFEHIHLKPGQKKKVTVRIEPEAVMLTDGQGERHLPQNEVTFNIGGRQPSKRAEEFAGGNPAVIKL